MDTKYAFKKVFVLFQLIHTLYKRIICEIGAFYKFNFNQPLNFHPYQPHVYLKWILLPTVLLQVGKEFNCTEKNCPKTKLHRNLPLTKIQTHFRK